MITDLIQRYNYVTKEDYEAVAGSDWPPFSQFAVHRNIDQFVYNEIDQMLRYPKQFSNPTFCVLPFYGIEYPSQSICCLIPPATDRAQLCKDMLEGIRTSACQACWKLEDAGVDSDRLLKNRTLDFYYDKNLEDLYEDCKQGTNSIVHYKIDTSNVCNASCVTCDSYFSTTWAQLERKNSVTPKKSWKIQLDQTTDWIDYPNAKSVSFRGGESFLSSTNFEILEKLLAANNNTCFVSFVTNGSIKLSSSQLDMLRQFKNTNICVSIDGTGSVFEYLRYPLSWDTVAQNVKLFQEQGVKVSVSYTLSNLNVLYYGETVDWFEQQQLPWHVNLVHQPSCFQVGALPLAVKRSIINKHQHTKWAGNVNSLLEHHTRQDDVNYQRLLTEIAKQDSWKNIQLKYYLPELVALLDH
jgi:hypothetical protein